MFIAMCSFCSMALFAPELRAQDAYTEINRMKLNIQETERLNQEQVMRLNAKITQLNENNTAVVNQLNAITAKVQEFESRNRQLETDMAALRKLLQEEIASRHESMKKFAGEISKEFSAANARRSAAMSAASASTAATAGGTEASSAAPEGEYVEYVVQKGATLAAIAKAYKVSMSDICRANNISKDTMLKVGQKLLIPKK